MENWSTEYYNVNISPFSVKTYGEIMISKNLETFLDVPLTPPSTSEVLIDLSNLAINISIKLKQENPKLKCCLNNNFLETYLEEIIKNAEYHGNQFDKNKKIEVEYVIEEHIEGIKVKLTVTDQGEGFNSSKIKEGYKKIFNVLQSDCSIDKKIESSSVYNFVAESKTGFEGKLKSETSGIGIYLIQSSCDAIRWNEKGNVVTIEKMFKYDPKKLI